MELSHPREIVRRPLFLPLLILVSFLLARDHFSGKSGPFPFPEKKSSYRLEVEKVEDKPLERKSRVTSRVLGVDRKPVSDEVPKVLLTVETFEPLDLEASAVIEFTAVLKKPYHYKNPGVFDYPRHLRRQGIGATAFIENPEKISVVSRGEVSFTNRAVGRLRDHVWDLVDHAGFSPEAKGVLIALLWGDESLLDPKLEELFRDQGLAHLLVISGLHFSVIALLVYQLILSIGRLIPSLFLYLPFRKIAAVLTLVIILFYFLLCEKNPSVVRATIAVVCYLIAMVIGRPRDFWNILFLAAFLILLVQPSDLFSLSFQFSFVAVLSLLVIFPRLKSLLPAGSSSSGVIRRFGRRLLDLVLVNLSIFLGLTPLLIFSFHEIQWNGLLMNLWAVPAIELVIVPVGLFGLFLAPIVPAAASLVFATDLFLIEQILSFLRFLSTILPHPSLAFPPRLWELAVYYAVLVILCFGVSRRLRTGALALVLVVLAIDGSVIAWRLTRGDDFRVTHLDVGQGDAILVELPGPRRLLIDGGGSPFFDFGERVLIPFLLHKRIPSLDAVCVTHSDMDHYGGLSTLLERFRVDELWWNGIESERKEYGRLFRVAGERRISLRSLREGDRFTWEKGVAIDVLSPGPDELQDSADNAHSIVLKIGAKGRTALFTADVEADVEARLAEEYGSFLDVDYLKVSHHGSRHSSLLTFLKLTSPEMATVGAKKSRFGHPHPDTVSRFRSLGIPLLETEKLGAVEIDLLNFPSPLGGEGRVRGGVH